MSHYPNDKYEDNLLKKQTHHSEMTEDSESTLLLLVDTLYLLHVTFLLYQILD